VRYVDDASFKTDFRILVDTVRAIFGHTATSPEIPPDAAERLGLPGPSVHQDLVRKA
jgi:hypothetical protein